MALFTARRALPVAIRATSVTLALVLFTSFGTACQSRAAASAKPSSSTLAVSAKPTPSAGSAAPNAANTTVLLYANMGEDHDECVCGQMIRAVRAAAGKGVKVREVDTRDKNKQAAVSKKYKIMVAPAVLFLDAKGKVTRRFEGESSDTMKALDSALGRLEKR